MVTAQGYYYLVIFVFFLKLCYNLALCRKSEIVIGRQSSLPLRPWHTLQNLPPGIMKPVPDNWGLFSGPCVMQYPAQIFFLMLDFAACASGISCAIVKSVGCCIFLVRHEQLALVFIGKLDIRQIRGKNTYVVIYTVFFCVKSQQKATSVFPFQCRWVIA